MSHYIRGIDRSADGDQGLALLVETHDSTIHVCVAWWVMRCTDRGYVSGPWPTKEEARSSKNRHESLDPDVVLYVSNQMPAKVDDSTPRIFKYINPSHDGECNAPGACAGCDFEDEK